MSTTTPAHAFDTAGLDACPFMPVFGPPQIMFVKGRGTELWRQKAQRECQAELIDKVVAEIGKPDLLARHEKSRHFRLARSIEGGQKAQQIARRPGT